MRFAYKFNFSIDMFDAHKSPVLDVAQTFVNWRWFCRITWVSLRYEYQYSLKYYLTCILIRFNLWIVVKMLENVHPVANPIEMQYIFKYKLCAMHYKWFCHCHFEFRLVSSWTKINKMKEKIHKFVYETKGFDSAPFSFCTHHCCAHVWKIVFAWNATIKNVCFLPEIE